MKEIVIASKNSGKITEIKQAFAKLPVKILSLASFENVADAVENGRSFAENALIKAKFYAQITGKACLADDSGLEVDVLQGAPGVYSARYAGETASDAANNAKLLREIDRLNGQGSRARFRCALAFIDEEGEILFCDGCCEGRILAKPRGNNGFGYDPLFYIEALGKTMAEINIEEKNQISHRGAALSVMARKLAGYLK